MMFPFSLYHSLHMKPAPYKRDTCKWESLAKQMAILLGGFVRELCGECPYCGAESNYIEDADNHLVNGEWTLTFAEIEYNHKNGCRIKEIIKVLKKLEE